MIKTSLTSSDWRLWMHFLILFVVIGLSKTFSIGLMFEFSIWTNPFSKLSGWHKDSFSKFLDHWFPEFELLFNTFGLFWALAEDFIFTFLGECIGVIEFCECFDEVFDALWSSFQRSWGSSIQNCMFFWYFEDFTDFDFDGLINVDTDESLWTKRWLSLLWGFSLFWPDKAYSLIKNSSFGGFARVIIALSMTKTVFS